MKTGAGAEILESLMKKVFVQDTHHEREAAIQSFTNYCKTHDISALLEPSDALETPLSQLLKHGFDNLTNISDLDHVRYWMPRFRMMNVIVDELYETLSGQAFFEKIAKHRTTNGFEILNFAIVKTNKERANVFIRLLQSMSPNDRLNFLRWQSHAGMNKGKTVLWLLSLGLVNETPWPFLAARKLFGSQMTSEDVNVVALGGQHQGKSVNYFWLLYRAQMIENATKSKITVDQIFQNDQNDLLKFYNGACFSMMSIAKDYDNDDDSTQSPRLTKKKSF